MKNDILNQIWKEINLYNEVKTRQKDLVSGKYTLYITILNKIKDLYNDIPYISVEDISNTLNTHTFLVKNAIKSLLKLTYEQLQTEIKKEHKEQENARLNTH